MNWDIVLTALGLGIVFILISPLYLAIYAAIKKIEMRQHLEFYIATHRFEMSLEQDEIDSALDQIFKGESN